MFLRKRKNKIQIFDNFEKKYQRRLALVYGLNPNQLNDFFVKLFLSDEKTPYEKNNLKDEIVDYLKKFFVADFAKKHNFDPQKVYELFPLYKRYAEVDEFDKLTHNLQSSLNLLTQFAFAKRDEIPTANIGSGILSVVGVFLSGLTLDLSYQKAKQKDQEKINELTQAQFEQIRTEKTQIFAQENGFASGEEMVQFLEENSFVVTKQDALNNFSSSQMQAFAESHNFVSYDELSTYILQNVEVVEKTRTIFNPATKTTYRQKYTTYEGSKEDVALYKERQTFENELSSALRDKEVEIDKSGDYPMTIYTDDYAETVGTNFADYKSDIIAQLKEVVEGNFDYTQLSDCLLGPAFVLGFCLTGAVVFQTISKYLKIKELNQLYKDLEMLNGKPMENTKNNLLEK